MSDTPNMDKTLSYVDAVIRMVGGVPDDPLWGEWSLAILFDIGELAMKINKLYGASLLIELANKDPSPEQELSSDELMELAYLLERNGDE